MIISNFVGAVPRAAADQIGLWVTDVAEAHGLNSVQVLCSGSFRLEEAIRSAGFTGRIIGNDISLLSCITGRFLMGDDHADIGFTGEHEKLNEAKSRALAAIALYGAMDRWRKRWIANEGQIDSILTRVEARYKQMDAIRESMSLDSFVEADLQKVAAETPADIIVGYPPIYAGGYEKLYKALETAIVGFVPPPYYTFKSDDFLGFASTLYGKGKPWLLGGYGLHPELPLRMISKRGERRSMYSYGEPEHPMLNTSSLPYAGMRFLPEVNPDRLRAKSNIKLCPMLKLGQMAAIMNSYHHVVTSASASDPLVVLLNGRFAGCFGFTYLSSLGGNGNRLLMIIDFAITGHRRLSKLIPMVARSREVKTYIEARRFYRYEEGLQTQVITDRPSSSKYRGTGFKCVHRKPGILSYAASWSDKSYKEIYRQWFQKHWPKKSC